MSVPHSCQPTHPSLPSRADAVVMETEAAPQQGHWTCGLRVGLVPENPAATETQKY